MATKTELLIEIQKRFPGSKARTSWGKEKLSREVAALTVNQAILDRILALNPESEATLASNSDALTNVLERLKTRHDEDALYARAEQLVGQPAPPYTSEEGKPSPGERVATEHLWVITSMLPMLTQANADLRYYKKKARWLETLFRERRKGNPALVDEDLLALADEFVFAISRCYVCRPTDADGNYIVEKDSES